MLSCQGYGGRASIDVTLKGLIQSVRAEEANGTISTLTNPGKVITSPDITHKLWVILHYDGALWWGKLVRGKQCVEGSPGCNERVSEILYRAVIGLQ